MKINRGIFHDNKKNDDNNNINNNKNNNNSNNYNNANNCAVILIIILQNANAYEINQGINTISCKSSKQIIDSANDNFFGN